MSRTFVADALRRRVAEAARFRCGYCLTSRRIIGPLLELDHIIPEARGGTSDEQNLFLACPTCNSHKANRVEAVDPDTGAVAPFFNPRTQRWIEHFEWVEGGARIRGRTREGRATVAALNMNHPDIVAARRLWCLAGWHPPSD
ncbi:HNH endonuclease signature motif containing protein [Sorangium sp. So ce291]|uniref:HNH endonuclease n=1 Tax=Sorangium sp. So ce291 TaxID=3133294 RepID=UPI003F625B1F